MAISTDTDVGRSDRRTPLFTPGSLSRYDLTLLVIPFFFLCSLVLGSALPVSTLTTLLAGSLLGTAVVVDALFLNPPTAR